MQVPPYHRSRRGRVFRVQRVSRQVADDRTRYVLRGIPVSTALDASATVEVAHEATAGDLREHLQRGHEAMTPERYFEQLWEQLRRELDAL